VGTGVGDPNDIFCWAEMGRHDTEDCMNIKRVLMKPGCCGESDIE
jgi:hypothetical protein